MCETYPNGRRKLLLYVESDHAVAPFRLCTSARKLLTNFAYSALKGRSLLVVHGHTAFLCRHPGIEDAGIARIEEEGGAADRQVENPV